MMCATATRLAPSAASEHRPNATPPSVRGWRPRFSGTADLGIRRVLACSTSDNEQACSLRARPSDFALSSASECVLHSAHRKSQSQTQASRWSISAQNIPTCSLAYASAKIGSSSGFSSVLAPDPGGRVESTALDDARPRGGGTSGGLLMTCCDFLETQYLARGTRNCKTQRGCKNKAKFQIYSQI